MIKDKDDKNLNGENVFNGDEEFFFGLLNDMVTFVGVLNPDGTVIFVNNTPLELAGMTLGDVKGKKFYDTYWWAYSDEAREKIREDVTRCASGKRLVHEIQAQIADGSLIWIEFNMYPVYDDTGNLKYIMTEGRDITERKLGKEQILRQSAVIDAVNRLYLETLVCESKEDVARACLAVAEDLTRSKFGLIGEVNQAGRFDVTAMSDPGWDACKMPKTDAVMLLKDMEIRGIWGQVIKKEQSQIVNDPASYPDRVGTPEDHPQITCFLGVPLKEAGKTIGMIGLANKEPVYEQADQQAIEDLSIAFVEAFNRKRVEEDTKQKVAYLDNMPTYMAVTDLEGSLQFTSAVTIEKFGFKLEDVIGTRFDQMVWWEYSEDVQERMREVVSEAAAGKSIEFEVDLRMGEELVPIKYTCDPLKDENNEIYALIHTGTRIDELRAAITDAREKVAYLDNMPTYMAVTDLEGSLQFTSAVTIEKFGFKLEDVIGTRFDQMVWWEYSEDVQERMREVVSEAAAGKSIEFEVDLRMGEELVPIKYTCDPLKDENNEIYALIHTGTRIDELRAALNDAQQKVAYLNNVPTPIMVVDMEYTIQFVNPSWLDMVGTMLEDAVGRKCYDLVRSADCQTERCCIGRAILEDSVITCERIVHSVKGDITTRYTGAPLKDAEGNIVGGLEYLVDISDLKRLTEEAKQLSEDILKLSTPIIQIWDKVLMLPLIGTIDEERAEQIVENLLEEIVATSVEVVIIDLSGVPIVDTMATHQLLKTESAARMLGARVIFTGISPDVAQTMTKLGIDLTRLETRQSLRVGLQEAIGIVRDVVG